METNPPPPASAWSRTGPCPLLPTYLVRHPLLSFPRSAFIVPTLCVYRSHALRGNVARPLLRSFLDAERPGHVPTQSVGTINRLQLPGKLTDTLNGVSLA